MTTATDSRRDLLTVIAHMRAKPGKEQELKDALVALVEPTAQQRGYVNEPVEIIVVRSTQEAIVVAVQGHPHAPGHAA